MFNKRTGNWFAVAVKEPREYTHIPELQDLILEKRATVIGPSSQKVARDPADPRNISRTLAPDDPPEMPVLKQRHISRHGLNLPS